MKKVFVTQIPNRRDATTQAFIPTVNIAPATEHGEIVLMMPAGANFFATADLADALFEHLSEYNYTRGDSFIALGDPSIISLASALLGRLHGQYIILKWDRKMGRYVPIHIDVRRFPVAVV